MKKELSEKLDEERINPSVCIASTDKDMDMIQGWHYNWRKDEKYYVDEFDATMFFYKQLLMGDPVDNIVGIPKIGVKKSEKIVTTIIDEAAYDNKPIEEEVYWEVLNQYAMHYDKPMEALLENGRLLWIRRENNDKLWEPAW